MLCNTYQMWFTELKSNFLFFSGTSTRATKLFFIRIWWKLYFGSDNMEFLHDNVLGISGKYRITVSLKLLTTFKNLVWFFNFLRCYEHHWILIVIKIRLYEAPISLLARRDIHAVIWPFVMIFIWILKDPWRDFAASAPKVHVELIHYRHFANLRKLRKIRKL